MAYYAGDIPAEDLIIEPERNGQLIDLTPFNGAEITLRSFDGVEVVTSGFIVTLDAVADRLVIEWPGEGAFPAPGLYTMHITLVSSIATHRERVAPYHYVVQGDDGWHSLDSARDQWENAPEGDLKLYSILWAARQEVTAYAPPLVDGARPPLNYLQAQIMQARNIWNAAKVDPASGGLGEDSFIIRPFPLDWMIVQILRPKSAIPRVG